MCVNTFSCSLHKKICFLAHSATILPEYGLPYLIYLLSHLPNVDYNEIDSLKDIKM